MIVWASGLAMGVGRISRPLSGVGVLAIPDAGLDTTRSVGCVCMVLLEAGVSRLLVHGVAGGVIIERRCLADGVEVTR
jgi:hypothetical protein